MLIQKSGLPSVLRFSLCGGVHGTCTGDPRGQRREVDILELELQVAVSNLTWVLGIELGFSGKMGF